MEECINKLVQDTIEILSEHEQMREKGKIGRELGKGTYGYVCEWKDRESNVEMVIKILDPEYIRLRTGEKNCKLQILKECVNAKRFAGLKSENLVDIYDGPEDIELENGRILRFVVMEKLYTIEDIEIKEDKAEQAIEILIGCCNGLASLHKPNEMIHGTVNGIPSMIHRDIKPNNIFVRYKQIRDKVITSYLIGDYGICEEAETILSEEWEIVNENYQNPYSAPGTIDYSSDIYSLGWILWYWLHEKTHPTKEDREWRKNYHKDTLKPKVFEEEPELWKLFLKMTEEEPEQRYGTDTPYEVTLRMKEELEKMKEIRKERYKPELEKKLDKILVKLESVEKNSKKDVAGEIKSEKTDSSTSEEDRIKKWAGTGDPAGQVYLAWCLELGKKGIAKNEKDAIEWYRKAAEQGYVNAQYDLGRCYQFKVKGKEAEKEAVKWYRKASEQGHMLAQYYLGYCYEKGKGVEKADIEEAIRWYTKSGNQGYQPAKEKLVQLTKEMKGVGSTEITEIEIQSNPNEDMLRIPKTLDKQNWSDYFEIQEKTDVTNKIPNLLYFLILKPDSGLAWEQLGEITFTYTYAWTLCYYDFDINGNVFWKQRESVAQEARQTRQMQMDALPKAFENHLMHGENEKGKYIKVPANIQIVDVKGMIYEEKSVSSYISISSGVFVFDEIKEKVKQMLQKIYKEIFDFLGEKEYKEIFIRFTKDTLSSSSGYHIRIDTTALENNPEYFMGIMSLFIACVPKYRIGPALEIRWLMTGIQMYTLSLFNKWRDEFDWELPRYHEGQSYKDGYRVTGAFLEFVEENYNENIVPILHQALRSGIYTKHIWKEHTDCSIEELWESYKEFSMANPKKPINLNGINYRKYFEIQRKEMIITGNIPEYQYFIVLKNGVQWEPADGQKITFTYHYKTERRYYKCDGTRFIWTAIQKINTAHEEKEGTIDGKELPKLFQGRINNGNIGEKTYVTLPVELQITDVTGIIYS